MLHQAAFQDSCYGPMVVGIILNCDSNLLPRVSRLQRVRNTNGGSDIDVAAKIIANINELEHLNVI